MARMHNPPHPGAILKEGVLPGLALSVTEAHRAGHQVCPDPRQKKY